MRSPESMGAAASAHLAPNTQRRNQRHAARNSGNQAFQKFMTQFDATKTGTLNHDEVKAMATELLNVWTPGVGGVTDEEVDLIMRIGGTTAKPELTVDELPKALSAMIAIKHANKELTELFEKYDKDASGHLPVDQLSGLLTEINDHVPVREADVAYIISQVTVDKATGITLVELKPAIASWSAPASAAHSNTRNHALSIGTSTLRPPTSRSSAARRRPSRTRASRPRSRRTPTATSSPACPFVVV